VPKLKAGAKSSRHFGEVVFEGGVGAHAECA